MGHTFELVHVGINCKNPEEAAQLAETLCALFNLSPKNGKKSVFAGNCFECMKEPFLGSNGHIAMSTADLSAAVEEMEKRGVAFRGETAAYDEKGRLKNIYLAGEFGGFAIHVLQA